ncbi:hypothetical protein C8R42DRAFT_773716 [Lentinula raphanica]|nr:hypothetical protein C8R42DRAFT_773716 [Lentinula raphanica]
MTDRHLLSSHRDCVLSPLDDEFPLLKNFEPSFDSQAMLWERAQAQIELITPNTIALESIDIGVRRRFGPSLRPPKRLDIDNAAFTLALDIQNDESKQRPSSPSAMKFYSGYHTYVPSPPSPLLTLAPTSNAIDLFARQQCGTRSPPPSRPLATSPRWNMLSFAT